MSRVIIKAVIFDFGQTLVDSANGFRAAEKDLQGKIFAALKPTLGEDFLSSYREIRKKLHVASNFSRTDIIRKVFAQFGKTADEKTVGQWEAHYWQIVRQHTVPFPETERVLETLHQTYRLAMIANTQGQKKGEQHRLYDYPHLQHFFEIIVLAGEHGVPPKPAPAPFRICLDFMGIDAAEAVFIGDDWRNDICGARSMGIHPIWLQHYSVSRNWPDISTDVPVIQSLDALLELGKLLP